MQTIRSRKINGNVKNLKCVSRQRENPNEHRSASNERAASISVASLAIFNFPKRVFSRATRK